MSYGVTADGFVIKRLADSLAEIKLAIRSVFGDGVKFRPDTEWGKIASLLADRESELWELAADLYSSRYPDTSSGKSLERSVRQIGITRKSATRSTVPVWLGAVNGTVIPSGTQFGIVGNTNKFRTTAPATIVNTPSGIDTITTTGGTATVTTTAPHSLVDGDIVMIDGALPVEYNGVHIIDVTDTDKFTFAIDGDPDDATGTVTYWKATEIDTEGAVTGPLAAEPLTITLILNPIPGLKSVTNTEQAIVGSNEETDAELLARSQEGAAIRGGPSVPSLTAILRAITGVKSVNVIENTDDTTDGDGRPGHSVECVVQDGDTATIAQAIFDNLSAGAETVTVADISNQVNTTVDFEGETYPIHFSRPTDVDIYVAVANLEINDDYPIDGNDQIKAAIMGYGAGLAVGDDVVVYPYLIAAIGAVPGIVDFDLYVGIAPSPGSSDNIVIPLNALAVFDDTRITFP